jgi:hypothetical protein
MNYFSWKLESLNHLPNSKKWKPIQKSYKLSIFEIHNIGQWWKVLETSRINIITNFFLPSSNYNLN